MASHGPPELTPFTKTRVYLRLEPSPLRIDQATDITAHVPTPFRTVAATGAEVAGPTMFGDKIAKEAKKAKEAKEAKEKKDAKTATAIATATAAEFPGLSVRRTKGKSVPATVAIPADKLYARDDVLFREKQAADIASFSPELQAEAQALVDTETTNPYKIQPPPTAFTPLTRTGFGSFLFNNFKSIFPTAAQRAADVASCAAKGEEGKKEVKIYHYQAFIREYLRYESPYRGLLVYHGLGSGKTCSAIAAAEALFGTRGMKIVVMTPFSLRDNFISEIGFCGFKHFRLQNHWTSLSLEPGSSPEPGMVKLFAMNVYGVPESFFAKRGRGRQQLNKIWIPDFEQKANFDDLTPEERDEISTQLKATIENRIKFINYNGISARELKTMVCSTPDVFDNSVIVVDEIHNLVRLIQGSLEVYLGARTTRGTTVAKEFLTPERKPLAQCGLTTAYMRGYLFYRLFMDAKNAKVIGLSGTPLINFPEELGIMMNIIHGPIHSMEFNVQVEGSRQVENNIEAAVKLNENLDTVFFKSNAADGTLDVTVTRLPEQFTKVLSDDSEILGIQRRDPLKIAATPTLEKVWEDLKTALKADGIQINGLGKRLATELLPSWDTPFRGAFLQEDGITLKNARVLQSRIRGLISYYRGIQGNVMPQVIKDEVVGVPMTGYSLLVYNKLRNSEIQIEMSKPKDTSTGAAAVWSEIGEIAEMKTSSNYRMSSRQACNFVFPETVTRPRPRNLEEQDLETGIDRDIILDADIEGKAAGKDTSDLAAEAAAELEQEIIMRETKGDVEGAAAAAAKVMGTRELAAAYKQAIKVAKDRLRALGPTHLMLDGPPEHNLQKYSPKFAAMLQKINSLPGSSLVYSQFLEMEGIGIFGICMEANGYVPIEIVDGADGKLKFSERTETSLLKGPGVPEKRYIEFTGVGTKEQRGAAVNVFNARLDKVSPEIQRVLKAGNWVNNLDGGLCRAFCITSAGAEGLSLKAVRGVHIMEPYWNTARTQQVKGRAVRICSHMDLPPSEQNVEIYTYCTMIPEEALLAQAVDKTLERSDTYSAKEAADLGVPVPAPVLTGAEIPAGLFLPIEQLEKMNTALGAQATMDGPIRFYSTLDNEYRWLSNFTPAHITIGGKGYKTVEHYFQSMKFPSEPLWQESIRVAPTPLKAKQLGADKGHKLREDWDTVKEGVMLEALRAKFGQPNNGALLALLKATGSRPLIEASPDAYWGEGRTGKGKNRLGKLLEQVREELREYVVPVGAAPAAVPEATQEKADFFSIAEGDLPVEDTTTVPAPTEPVLPITSEPVVAVPPTVPVPVAEEVVAMASPVPMAIPEPEPEAVPAAMAAAEPELVAPPMAEPMPVPAAMASPAPEPMPAAMASPEPLPEEAPSDSVPVIAALPQKGGEGDERVIILTSDQKVLLISLRKERVIGTLQTLMKTVAADCTLNFPDNNDGSFKCVGLNDSITAFAYHPSLERDIQIDKEQYGEETNVVPGVVPREKLAESMAAVAAERAAGLARAEGIAAGTILEKPQRMGYRKQMYRYRIKLGAEKKRLGYILYNINDLDGTTPIGYVLANPESGAPKGEILPPPTD